MNKPKNEARNEKWLQLYKSGTSIASIANQYGYTVTNVYSAIKRLDPGSFDGKRGRQLKPEPIGMSTEFKTILLNGSVLVLRNFKRQTNEMPQPNFLNSGMALCAVLREGESIEQWMEKFNSQQQAV